MLLNTFKDYPQTSPDEFFFIFFFNNKFELSTDLLQRKLLHKECLVFFDKDTKIIDLDMYMILDVSFVELCKLILNAEHDNNVISNIEAYNSTKYWQDRLNNGYRGISI